jgi:3-phosphoglycerate kinase
MIHYLRDANYRLLHGTALLSLNFDTEDDWRVRATIPTLKFLLKKSQKVVVVSHHGRPSGFVQKLSLKKNAIMLARLLGKKVIFIPHFDFKKIKARIENSPQGSIFLLENLRFNKGEWDNDPKLAKKLASLADFYVNDDFATAHHANASNVAITKFLPSYAGFELEHEIISLTHAMKKPRRPLVFIVGGAKAADKLGVLKYFKHRTDWFLLGGGPANTILSLRGMDVKKSVRDMDKKDITEIAAFSRSKKVLIPTDFRWHADLILDIGPKTIASFSKKIAMAKTIIWSGPLGLIEKPSFARGSVAIARAITRATVRPHGAFSLTGGGETVMFLKNYKLDKKFSFISTGGGAMLDFLAGKKLVAIEALSKNKKI